MRDKQENWELWGLQYKTKGRSPVAGLKVKKSMTVFVKDFVLTFLSNFNNNMDNGQGNHSWAVVHFIADKLKFSIFRHCQQTWMSFMNKWSNHRTNNVTHSSWVFWGFNLVDGDWISGSWTELHQRNHKGVQSDIIQTVCNNFSYLQRYRSQNSLPHLPIKWSIKNISV